MSNSFYDKDAAGLAAEAFAAARRDEKVERVQRSLNVLMEVITDDLPEGCIVSWTKVYDERTYHYAAIKGGNKWFGTSAAQRVYKTTDELIVAMVALGATDNMIRVFGPGPHDQPLIFLPEWADAVDAADDDDEEEEDFDGPGGINLQVGSIGDLFRHLLGITDEDGPLSFDLGDEPDDDANIADDAARADIAQATGFSEDEVAAADLPDSVPFTYPKPNTRDGA